MSRVREITIRMALGATHERMIVHVLGRYAEQLLPAVLVSIPMAIWVCSRIERLADPLPIPAISSLVATAGAAALVCVGIVASIVRRRIGINLVLRE